MRIVAKMNKNAVNMNFYDNVYNSELNDVNKYEQVISDCNDATVPGNYVVLSDTVNKPETYGVLNVKTANGTAWIYQIFESASNGVAPKIYTRSNINNSGWSGWVECSTNIIAQQVYIELPVNQIYYDIQIDGITEMSPVVAARSYDTNIENPSGIYIISNGVPSPGTLRIKFNKAPVVSTAMRVSLIYKLN